MLQAFAQAFRTPDLRRKILFSLMIMALYRLGTFIPTPGVSAQNINACLAQQEQTSLLDMFNLFSGGALMQLSIFALGIMPYITASIIIQVLRVAVPRLQDLYLEGQSGQATLTQYTRYLTIFLAVLQSTTMISMAASGQMFPNCSEPVIPNATFSTYLFMVVVMTAGTSVIMWFGELITERGVGNGMSLLIFTSIVATMPMQLWDIGVTRGWMTVLVIIVIILAVTVAVVFVEQSQRRIPVQYAKRMVGRRTYGGTTTYIPLKVNQAGVIPVIFASSILYLPVLYTMFNSQGKVAEWIMVHLSGTGQSVWYNVIYLTLIIAFTYFYVAITFDPVEVSDNMKKYGGFIPGIRAGKPTEDYLAYVLSRLTAPGSAYLALISLLPTLAMVYLGANQNFPFGGTSILIIVGVGLDTVKQIEGQLQQRHYEGFLK